MKKIIRLSYLVVVCAALTAFANPALSAQFDDELERVDAALKETTSVEMLKLRQSCLKQRNFALKLQRMGMHVEARRSLSYCFDTLRISRTAPVVKVTAPNLEELQAKANREYEKALTLTPDVANGLAIYRECATCHKPEGWGSTTGTVPQIAGQQHKVVIRQLADYRAGNRDSVLMAPYATVEAIGGTQAVADVAAYISTLEMNVTNGHGSGKDLELGKRLYEENCAECHGESGEGSNDDLVPRLQAQHYRYLLRQFQWIRDGKRRNANAKMVEQIQQFEDNEIEAVLDYSSRLMPAEEFRAPADWKNPDFN